LPALEPEAPRRPFWTVAGPFARVVFVGALCVSIWAVASIVHGRLLYFWPMWVVGPWAIALAFSGGSRRGYRHGCRRDNRPKSWVRQGDGGLRYAGRAGGGSSAG
jgi:hypothetical protein